MVRKSAEGRLMSLEELSITGRGLMVGNGFLITDTLDSPDVLELLDESGMSGVLDGIPFKIRFSMFLACERGDIRLRLGMKEYAVAGGDLLIAREGSIGELLDISPGASLFMLAFSKEFCMADSDVELSAVPRFLIDVACEPVVSLSPAEMRHLKNVYDLLRFRLDDPQFTARRQLALNCLRVIYSFISDHLEDHRLAPSRPLTRGEELLKGFLSLVERYSVSHRDLDFYSDKLYVSSKYLSKVVSLTSGMPARHWICLRVIMEAKVLLKDRSLSIEKVSEMLNFPSQSFFGTFFKRHVGMSPLDYRARLRT